MKIYISFDALLVPSDKPSEVLRAGIAPYAKSFITWAATQGRVVILTDGPLSHPMHLLQHIKCADLASIRSFEVSKTETLRHDEPFFLVDDALIPGEVSWFMEHGHQDRIIPVSPREGVTPRTKQLLEEKLRHVKR